MGTPIVAVVFDVFGTLVDWRGSIAREAAALLGLALGDAASFADDWRARYQPSMAPVRDGAAPYRPLDRLHADSLDALLDARGLAADVDAPARHALVLAWHRLDAWDDVGDGLARLRRRFLLAPCSNGNVRLMADLARHNRWHWDAVCGADLARDYKPKPAVYLAACAAFDAPPAQVLMVAAHSSDLEAAAACGLRTAFVARPDEHGPGRGEKAAAVPVDFSADDLTELAERLGA